MQLRSKEMSINSRAIDVLATYAKVQYFFRKDLPIRNFL